jgi:hypothetical protein
LHLTINYIKRVKTMRAILGNKNGEKDAGEVVKLLLENKTPSGEQKQMFLSTNFWTVMKDAAEFLDMEYSDASVPYIVTEITKKAPNFFYNVGIPIGMATYAHPKSDITSDMMSLEEKIKFINTKKSFNERLDEHIKNSKWFGQVTEDYDIIGDAKILEPELRDEHIEIGESRLKAFRDAISKNKAEVNVLMRVIKDDGETPYAPYTANRLVEAGVKVFNYERGEKFGAFRTAEVLKDCREKFKNAVNKFGTDIKTISEATRLDKKTLEKYEKGEIPEISFDTAKELQNYFSEQVGNRPEFSPVQLVSEDKYVFMFSRKFHGKEMTQATEPQLHKYFKGLMIKDWEKAYEGIEGFIERRKSEAQPITKDVLKRFGY